LALLGRVFRPSQLEAPCPQCAHPVAEARPALSAAPEALVLQLQRFRLNKRWRLEKLTESVQVDPRLDVASFMAPGAAAGCTRYALFALVCHRGQSLHAGHYYTLLNAHVMRRAFAHAHAHAHAHEAEAEAGLGLGPGSTPYLDYAANPHFRAVRRQEQQQARAALEAEQEAAAEATEEAEAPAGKGKGRRRKGAPTRVSQDWEWLRGHGLRPEDSHWVRLDDADSAYVPAGDLRAGRALRECYLLVYVREDVLGAELQAPAELPAPGGPAVGGEAGGTGDGGEDE
jgi:hypothetical protein